MIKSTPIVGLAMAFSFCLFFACQAPPQVEEDSISSKVDLVYPFLDAANSRWFFFSSACRPFGMVNLSPDTEIDGAWGSGYRYNTDTIRGLSHVHAWQMAGLSVLPVHFIEGEEQAILEDFYSPFSHDQEEASPGWHKLQLDRYDIAVELTSTTRVGFHKYQYAVADQRGIVFNLGGKMGPSTLTDGKLEKAGNRLLVGSVTNMPTRRRPRDLTVYFAIELDHDVEEIMEGEDGKFLVKLDEESNALLMKAAISYTSIENAQLNLERELPEWNFDEIKTESQQEWNRLLSRIDIEGGTEEDQRRFYTDLWHALQGRRIISDVNGAYPDNTTDTFQIGQLPLQADGKPQFNHYNSDSFWGAQWTLNTLWGLAYPEIYEEFVNSLLIYYKDGGFIPRGPSGGNYTHVMTGASSTPFIVSAYQKGIKGFDVELAYEGMKKNHMPGGTMGRAGYEHKTTLGGGLQYYIDQGYVPYPIPEGSFGYHQDGPSLTMEYAYQDWTLAQMASSLGKAEDAQYFLKRAKNYANTYDSGTSWMRPKAVNGDWQDPFDPYTINTGFNESNSAQSTWFVPHDLVGLADLMGGKEKAIEKLQTQFEKAKELNYTAGDRHERESHPEYSRIPINYGNQPSIQTAFVFHHLGRPDLSQYWSRQVAQKVYGGLHPETGYKGDEDQGLMGAMAVLLKIGLFQMTGGTEEDPSYQLGSPIFDKIKIQLHPDYSKGGSLSIETVGNDAGSPYIQAATWNGSPISDYNIKHSQLIQGGELKLEMGAEVPK
ncbi:MAG: GH92 family glycosyl hydrolase [Saprospiraceae bacterium]|nr:GH92 family glycosyl hydrolase [Saprospiraceae bacterium]